MDTSENKTREESAGAPDSSIKTSQTEQTAWAHAAHKRLDGKIGDGLLCNIENRLGSIA